MIGNPPSIQTVILADDDEDDHDLFRNALKEVAPKTKLAIVKDGRELIELLESYVSDFIFLDLDMPLKNGLECLKEIRKDRGLKHLPVIIFSSTSRPVNIQTAYEMGCDLFFIKPQAYRDMVFSLKAILELPWNDRQKIRDQYCNNGRYLAFL
jgi:CheY-like chemotaxis protein